jgi:hypothetical protein
MYRDSKGKFISKEKWLSLQENKPMKNKKTRKKKVELSPPINEEQLNPSLVDTLNDIESQLDIEYKEEVKKLEESIDKAFTTKVVKTEPVVEKKKYTGIFRTILSWFE